MHHLDSERGGHEIGRDVLNRVLKMRPGNHLRGLLDDAPTVALDVEHRFPVVVGSEGRSVQKAEVPAVEEVVGQDPRVEKVVKRLVLEADPQHAEPQGHPRRRHAGTRGIGSVGPRAGMWTARPDGSKRYPW